MKRNWRLVTAGLAVVWFFAAAVCARAGLEEGKAAYRAGKYAEALAEFLPLAEGGDVTAQNQVAAMYYIGQGTPHDFIKAAQWFQKAAEAGDADAQYCLGKLFLSGQGVPQDFESAAKLLTEAALAGKGGAQQQLAMLYLSGQGVPQNPVKAYFWALLAVTAPDLPAENKASATALRGQIEATLAPRQIKSIQTMAHDWAPRVKKAE